MLGLLEDKVIQPTISEISQNHWWNPSKKWESSVENCIFTFFAMVWDHKWDYKSFSHNCKKAFQEWRNWVSIAINDESWDDFYQLYMDKLNKLQNSLD